VDAPLMLAKQPREGVFVASARPLEQPVVIHVA
jgi:hypothetical protein